MLRRTASLALLLVAASTGVASARRCPNVMLVIDRSGSMLQAPDGKGASNNNPSKWDLVKANVGNAMSTYANRVPFGITSFSSFGGGASCYNDTSLDIDVGPKNGPAIIAAINRIMPAGNTNTGEAIKRAVMDSKHLNDPMRANVIVLITDGTPNCNLAGKGEPQNTIDAIAAAAALNPPVHTFVVGFDAVQDGTGVDPVALNKMARAGKEPQVDCKDDPMLKAPCYYSASTAEDFKKAMDNIIGGLAGTSVIAACDDTCFSLGCPDGQNCIIPKVGADPICVPDACAGKSCEEGTYCKDGKCLKPCPTCNVPDEKCVMEACVPAFCNTAQKSNCAGSNKVCNEEGSNCAPNLCVAGSAITCPLPTTCDPITNTCADDPCRLINCPALSTCYNGFCMTDPPEAMPDMFVAPDLSFDNGNNQPDLSLPVDPPAKTGSCALAANNGDLPAGSAAAPLLLLAVGTLLMARRRRAWR